MVQLMEIRVIRGCCSVAAISQSAPLRREGRKGAERLQRRAPLAIVSPMYNGGDSRFPVAMRLRKQSDFARVYRFGRIQKGTYFSFHILPYGGGERMGIVIPRRWGTAVERNRMKRLLREVFRCHRDFFLETEFIVRPHEICKGCRLEEIERAFLTEFRAPKEEREVKYG
jgi:ribonuclease P protein component